MSTSVSTEQRIKRIILSGEYTAVGFVSPYAMLEYDDNFLPSYSSSALFVSHPAGRVLSCDSGSCRHIRHTQELRTQDTSRVVFDKTEYQSRYRL